MTRFLKAKDFLKKIQGLPEGKRKIILWSVVIAIGLALIVFWFLNIKQAVNSFDKGKFFEEMKLPDASQETDFAPSEDYDLPSYELFEEELKKLENE